MPQPITSSGASASELPPALVLAYRQAWYEVLLPQADHACTLQVDVPHPALRCAMQALGARQAALLTACNPLGELSSADDNAARMQALRHALQAEGWTWAPALGRDPLSQWPGEDSLLVWHMGRAQAGDWGRRWQQNAVLYIDGDATPLLELLR